MKDSSNNSAITVELEILRQYRGKALWTALATLIDGEGYVGLLRDRPESTHFCPTIVIANTCHAWMQAWRDRLGRGRLYIQDRNPETQKSALRWVVNKRADAVYILKHILPYLIVKRERAELLLSFYTGRPLKGTWLGEEELLRREKIYWRLRDLNKKGPSESVETKRRTSLGEDVIVQAAELSAELDANDLVN